jgi:hypothetical protein
MGAIQIPQPSTIWVELGTSSPTSGSSVSFTSLAEYRNYKLYYFDVDVSSSVANFTVTFNGDTASNYAYISTTDTQQSSNGVASSIQVGSGAGAQATNHSGTLIASGANQVTKDIAYWHASSSGADSNSGRASWNSASVINRIDLILTGSVTFTSGTVKVYGSN